MLFISRPDLEGIKASLEVARLGLRTSNILKPGIHATDNALEAAALLALSILVSMDLGWSDSVHAIDVHQLGEDGKPIFVPPNF